MLNYVLGGQTGFRRKLSCSPQNDQSQRFFGNPSRAIPVIYAMQFYPHEADSLSRNPIFHVVSVKKVACCAEFKVSHDPRSFDMLIGCRLSIYCLNGEPQNYGLNQANNYEKGREDCDPSLYFDVLVILFFFGIIGGGVLLLDDHRYLGIALFVIGCSGFLSGETLLFFCDPLFWRALGSNNPDRCQYKECGVFHGYKLYHKNYLTRSPFCNTVSLMANLLSAEKQTAIIAALAEGSSIRSIERITGVHRDTIMRLGVRVGKGCQMLMDSKMQDLDCHYLQFDELWGFIGKKERHVSVDDSPELGDVWTFCAIDSETKLVPSFKVGKRTHATTTEFVQDVASRMRHRVQVSSDAMHLYVEAMELAFGSDVDYGQCVKVYVHDSAHHPERQYSAPHFASAVRRPITGQPEMELVSTSHVERLNATTRLHMRRLTRLTLAFSKKLENFEAAVGLHFAYYNFVKRHNTLRCTPAMAAGVERDFWSVGKLIEAVS